MKKSLIAIAVLGAAAFSAQAANVTLYGTVDAGVMYKHNQVKVDGVKAGDTENSFKMADGLDGANKIGIKGEEDLGNMKVGFKLENQFKISNGEFKDSSKLFSREARMYVKSDFGELAAGRFGGLASAAGSYDVFFGNADAFDGGDNDIPYAFATSSRYDNSIAYQSPVVAGFQGTLMYSFQKEGEQADKMKNNERYVGVGLTYNYDALNVVGVFEGQIRDKDNKNDANKNGFTYNLGANYDFDVAKVFAGGQIARNTNLGDIQAGSFFGDFLDKQFPAEDQKDNRKAVLKNIKAVQMNGYAFTLGTQLPIAADKITLGAYYGQYKNASNVEVKHQDKVLANDVKIDKKDGKLRIYGISGRYEHQLSKRSTIYAGAGVGQSKLTYPEHNVKQNIGQVYMGLHHNF